MIYTRYSKYSLLFLVLFAITTFAQIEKSSMQVDSMNSTHNGEYKLKFNNSNKAQSALSIIKPSIIFDEYSLFVLPKIQQSSVNDNISMMQLRDEINQSMNIYREGQNKYQLGVVGDILGYVSSAAAAGIAVYHLHKYKKYYGIK